MMLTPKCTERTVCKIRLGRVLVGIAILCLAASVAIAGCGGSSTPGPGAGSIIDLSACDSAADGVVSLAFAGDVNLGNGVAPYVSSGGIDYPWEYVREYLRGADLAFVNLECALSDDGSAVPGKTFCFRGDPETAVGISSAGIDVVSLANNHSLDFGASSLFDTLEVLKGQGIACCGAGGKSEEAYQPAILEVGGKRVAFLAFCDILPYGWSATEDTPGVASARDHRLVVDSVGSAAREYEFVVASFHWGVELATEPNSTQRELGRAAVDAGADVVVGHHPHVVQGFEFYGDGLIAYSLGNFVFSPPREISSKTLLLEVFLGPQGVTQAELIPIRISGCRPVVMGNREGEAWLSQVAGYCADLGTEMIIGGNRGYLTMPRE